MTQRTDDTFQDELCAMVTIVNPRGLHARAAAKFVRALEKFDAEIEVIYMDTRISGRSIMGLMMMAASQGTRIQICANGPDAVDALQAVTDLVMRGFDEI